ncbi:unnamed protein product [Rhizoctonia solani]|nr:unnamed protein product [Rhizoctonia solani]
MFQLTTLPQLGLSANRLSAVYTLLEGCFSDLDASLWKGELELLHDWVTNLMSDTRADQIHQEGAQQLTNLLNRMLNKERGPDNSEDLGQAFGRLSISVTAQPIADELDTSTVENDGDHPPNLNNIVLNLGEIVCSPLSSSPDEGGDGMGNNYGDYMHEAGSVDPLDNIINSDEADTSPGLNAGVHRPVSKRYGHIIHPFAVVDALQPESRPTRPTVLCARHYSSSSESSFSSAGSTSTPALSASSPISLPNAVAALILNKKQKKNRLAKVVEMQAEQQKKAKETPEKAKRSKEDTVLDWLERESATRGQEDFQLRLTQWLLDQLNSHAEFETVSQQIGLMISQVQEQSIAELYATIGELIFQKMTSTQQEGSALIPLCAQLCCSLLVVHLRHYSTLSPRVSPIHEHILRLCVEWVPARTPKPSVNTDSSHRSTAGVSAAHPSVTPLDVPMERICEIVLQLHDFQLISTVQVLEYMFRTFEQRKTFVGSKFTSAVAGMRLLLDICFPHPYFGTWKNEVDYLRNWVDKHTNSSAEQSNVTSGSNTRTGGSHFATKAEGHSNKENRSTSSPDSIFRPTAVGNSTSSSGTSSNNRSDFATNSIKDSSSPNDNRSQGQIDKAVEMDATTENNYGSPPHRVGSLGSPYASTKESELTKLVQNKPISFGKSVGSVQSVTPRGPATSRLSPLTDMPSTINKTPSTGAHSSGSYRTSFAAVAAAGSVKSIPANAAPPEPSQSILSATSALTTAASAVNIMPPKGNVHALLLRRTTTAPGPTNTPDKNTSMKVATSAGPSIATPPSHRSTSSSTPSGSLAPLGVQQWPYSQTESDGYRVPPNCMDWDDTGCNEPPADQDDDPYPEDYYPDEDDYYPDEDNYGGYY